MMDFFFSQIHQKTDGIESLTAWLDDDPSHSDWSKSPPRPPHLAEVDSQDGFVAAHVPSL